MKKPVAGAPGSLYGGYVQTVCGLRRKVLMGPQIGADLLRVAT
jgi:hypothetical protein